MYSRKSCWFERWATQFPDTCIHNSVGQYHLASETLSNHDCCPSKAASTILMYLVVMCCVKVDGASMDVIDGKLPRTKLKHFFVVTIGHLSSFIENGGRHASGREVHRSERRLFSRSDRRHVEDLVECMQRLSKRVSPYVELRFLGEACPHLPVNPMSPCRHILMFLPMSHAAMSPHVPYQV